MTAIMTPLREVGLGGLSIHLKLEEFTPSGSHKDRPTKMIADSLRRNGKFHLNNGKKPLFLIGSSGNFGNGFAYHTQEDKVDVVVISDVLSSVESRDKLKGFKHVKLEVVNDPDETGSHLKARQRLLQEYLENPRKNQGRQPHIINQYCDRCVPLAYELSLASEIDKQTEGKVATAVVSVGTGGTLNGILKYIEKHHLNWKVIAADARGSRLFHDPAGCKRRFPGYGNGQPTALIDEISRDPFRFTVVHIDDQHAALACHRMYLKNRMLLGPSSGACIAAVETAMRFCPEMIPDTGHIVAVMPDSGRNYLSTLYSSDWLVQNDFGKVVGFVGV